MGYRFGKNSVIQLATCHRDLQLILTESLAVSPIDFGVSEGRRTFEKQLEYFFNEKTELDPRIPAHLAKAKHVTMDNSPSMAADVYAWVPGKPQLQYDFNHLCVIFGVVWSTAECLLRAGAITHHIRWGGNWDRDGEVITDQKFNDLPHFELIQL